MSGPDDHWFEAVADHLGPAYLRYSFTKGTDQEVGFLVEALGLKAGDRVLDVGCGPGRHSHALARLGVGCHGVDISERFVELAAAGAPAGATFERLDARHLRFDSEFDAAISLCQGAFGLLGGPGHDAGTALDDGEVDDGRDTGWTADSDTGSAAGARRTADSDAARSAESDAARSAESDAARSADSDVRSAAGAGDSAVLEGMARAVRPGGRVVVSAFSAYFQLRWLEDTDTFDPVTGVNHERTVVRDPDGAEASFDLWTTCFTPRELRLMAAAAGLEVDHLWGVTPGAYRAQPPSLTLPELLLVAHRP